MSEYWYLYVIAILAFGYAALKYSQRNSPIESVPRAKLEPFLKNMTLDELNKYGPDNERVLLALRGIIYDVSASDFYTKDGAYSLFAGHDSSLNLAKMSHDKSLLNKYGSYTLDRDEENVLNDWVSRF